MKVMIDENLLTSHILWELASSAHHARARQLNRMPGNYSSCNRKFIDAPFLSCSEEKKAVVIACIKKMKSLQWKEAVFIKQVRVFFAECQAEGELYFSLENEAEHFDWCETISKFVLSAEGNIFIQNTVAYSLYLRSHLLKKPDKVHEKTRATLARFLPDIPEVFCENLLFYTIANSDWRSLFANKSCGIDF
jgi:hypothetical protein